MTGKSSDTSGGSDFLPNDDPPQEQWYLKYDNDRAARLAHYAVRAYLN